MEFAPEDAFVDLQSIHAVREVLGDLCERQQFLLTKRARRKLDEVEANYLVLVHFFEARTSGYLDLEALAELAGAMLTVAEGQGIGPLNNSFGAVCEGLPSRSRLLLGALVEHLVNEQNGKASSLWEGKAPMGANRRLVEAGLGENGSRHLVNHLISLGAIKATCGGKCGNARPSKPVARTLARCLVGGDMITPEMATTFLKIMDRELPWSVDLPLFMIGSTFCRRLGTTCHSCPLVRQCIAHAAVHPSYAP
jgi:hypothetical protein